LGRDSFSSCSAARYLFLLLNTFANRLSFDSFSYSMEGRPGGGSSRMMAHVWRLFDRLERVTIESLDFEELFARYDRPRTFFYCDPPYWLDKAPYKHNLTPADQHRLAACLAGLKGKWLLSLNDRPEVRELYAAYTMEEVGVVYGISRDKGASGQQGRELLIRNY
jgi:DNA adenine methylase